MASEGHGRVARSKRAPARKGLTKYPPGGIARSDLPNYRHDRDQLASANWLGSWFPSCSPEETQSISKMLYVDPKEFLLDGGHDGDSYDSYNDIPQDCDLSTSDSFESDF